MFATIRLTIGCIVLILLILFIKKSKILHKKVLYFISTISIIIIVTISVFIPFENAFISFYSPETVYKYMGFENYNINLVINGNDTDMVIGGKNTTTSHLIVPKTSDGWKIGITSNTKIISRTYTDKISVHIYQYKNSDDYYITIYDNNGGYTKVSDNYNSEFLTLKSNNKHLEKTFVTYYAHIPKFDQDYHITINGKDIYPERIANIRR